MPRNSDQQTDVSMGYLILRVTIGLNIFMHGLSRILAGPANFAHILIPMFQHTFLPVTSVYLFGLCLPWAEAAVGFFLLIGIYTRYVILAGALLMISLTFGATLRQDWESAGLQLIYVAIYAALLAFRQHNQFSADRHLRRSETD